MNREYTIRRSRLEVIRDILDTIRKETKAVKSKIFHFANLNPTHATHYINFLLEKGLISYRLLKTIRPNRCYIITQEGKEALTLLNNVLSMVEGIEHLNLNAPREVT